MFIKSATWSRDSHGLYDYESRSVQKKQIQAVNSVCVVRIGTDVQQVSDFTDFSRMGGYSPLCIIEQDKSDFFLKPYDSEPLWLVVRSMRSQYGPGCILSEGDIVKLGRVSFKITSLSALEKESPASETQSSEDMDLEIPNERECGACKICLFDDSGPDNPLISPCSCSGSMKHIHLACLQRWLASRMISRNTENCVTYSWKSMECEICKSQYPFSFCSRGRDTDLFKVEKPQGPYIVLEAIASDRNNNRGIHIISVTNKNSVKLGRGHDSDVRISDISVSRLHAVVKLRDGMFMLEDNNSKFGTLIKACDKIKVLSNSSVVIQTGRTLISMAIKGQNIPFEVSGELDLSADENIDMQIGKRSI